MSRRPDVYISGDIEADGPIPGPYSMLSFGMTVIGSHGEAGFSAADPTEQTFYVELKPISDGYDNKALAVSGLDRDRLIREGTDPAEAMDAASAWVRKVARGGTAVFAGYPAHYDWMWLYWYFLRFGTQGSPFGHSRCLDLKTFYAARARVPLSDSIKRRMPHELMSSRPHTHNALDDAIEQAELAANLLRWPGPR